MNWKRNIYDADDAARSKRLKFTPEERAENAKKKAEVLGGKLEQAKQDLPKQRPSCPQAHRRPGNRQGKAQCLSGGGSKAPRQAQYSRPRSNGFRAHGK